ncbi:hypothetical protein MTR67_010718 [Solanum verrucosum]|uniref:Uncharacterized protein n=1 Tax=Solanum verrucosum TaxID=315347 RepID=A0AAF0TIL7_SOLVR|nr:hypothetical protein MTR67_010718 [Solanum verrucosum]
MASSGKSIIQTLKRFMKKPWEFTGPQTSPEYLASVPKATEYRIFCPATTQSQAIIPTSDPETVFDIKLKRMRMLLVAATRNEGFVLVAKTPLAVNNGS